MRPVDALYENGLLRPVSPLPLRSGERGENLAFATLADNFEGPGAAATDAIDRIAVRLAAFSRTAPK